uniref:Uncharacterized protein n=1 Tax=Romanomermis culicivorax TaxID=13658 RepID=A0A915K488_ROMCU
MKVITTKNKDEKNRGLEKRKERATVRNRKAVNPKSMKAKKGRKERRGREKDGKRRRKHDNHLDVSYSSGAPSLDKARNNEVAQPGTSMCDPNAMLQAQQPISYLPPNYPGLPMAQYLQVVWCHHQHSFNWHAF